MGTKGPMKRNRMMPTLMKIAMKRIWVSRKMRRSDLLPLSETVSGTTDSPSRQAKNMLFFLTWVSNMSTATATSSFACRIASSLTAPASGSIATLICSAPVICTFSSLFPFASRTEYASEKAFGDVEREMSLKRAFWGRRKLR